MTETQQRKLGNHRGGKRVWLEGKHLTNHGFHAKETYFQKKWRADVGLLTLVECSAATPGARRVSGKGDKPVIDITGQTRLEVFGSECEEVRNTYEQSAIKIELA